VSADEIVVAITGKAERLTLANDLEGHARLVRLLTRGQAGARVCLEATGIYHLDLALALHRAPRIEVSVLNPASVPDFGRALMERSKTDRVDAGVLLAYAERMPFSAWQPPAPAILDLRAIVRRMGALTVTRTQERNRLHAAGHCAELTEAVAWNIEAHLEHLAQSLERLAQQALAIVNSDAELARRFERLVSVRGIATTSALAILAELAVLPPDMTARQWVAHAGLDPSAEGVGHLAPQAHAHQQSGKPPPARRALHARHGLGAPRAEHPRLLRASHRRRTQADSGPSRRRAEAAPRHPRDVVE
jgi:transposase